MSNKQHYHKKGQKDASKGEYDPPHSGIIDAIDRGVREVILGRESVERDWEEKESYEKGHRATRDQKRS